MSTGGYKCVKFSWQGGRSDTPVDRVKFILNGVCDAIIGANVGWQLDTLTPTSSDFIEMPGPSSTNWPNLVKFLKLTYDNHNYLMGIGLFYGNNYSTSFPQMKPTDCTTLPSGEVLLFSGRMGGGIYACIVKDGGFTTDSTYSLVWNGQGQFIRWVPLDSGITAYNNFSFVYQNNASYVYSYYFLLKNAQVGIFGKSTGWTGNNIYPLKGMILGEVFKETGHSSDSITFGSIGLNYCTAGEITPMMTQSPYNYLIASIPGSVYQIPFSNSGNPYASQSQIFSADGTWYAGCLKNPSDSFSYASAIWYNTSVVGNNVSNTVSSPGGRWTPVYMYINAADHDTYCVVPGDGFKGYIDTDLLRGVNPNYSYGQQLQGGDFVYLGGGFAIGWDADNEILLF